jgi:hypothetical protein
MQHTDPLGTRPDWFGGTPLGSSLHPGKARFILSLSSLSYDSLKIFISFIFLYRVFFTSKNTRKYPYSLKAVKGAILPQKSDPKSSIET